jgi:hypothetical protein
MRTRPSYHSGFARSAAESDAPDLWRSLWGAWVPMLGNTGQTLFDHAGRRFHGTGVNGPTWAVGKHGWMMEFNGSSQYVNLGTLGDFGSSQYRGATLDAWLQTSYTGGIQAVMRTANAVTGYNTTGILLSRNANSGADPGGLQISCNDQSKYLVGGTPNGVNTGICDGNIHHLAVTIWPPANAMQMYLDGRAIQTNMTLQQSPTSYINFPIAMFLGAANHSGTPSFYFNGRIGLARVWNRVLSLAEIRGLYADPLGMFRERRRVYGGFTGRRRRLLICGEAA